MCGGECPACCQSVAAVELQLDETQPGGKLKIQVTSGAYKSIGPMEWDDVPPMAVLTGVNGSGKTQFLELINAKLTKSTDKSFGAANLQISGVKFAPSEVVYIQTDWRLRDFSPVSIAQLQNVASQLFDPKRRNKLNPRQRSVLDAVVASAGVSHSELSQQDFLEHLPLDYAIQLQEYRIQEGLEQVFFTHRVRATDLLAQGLSAANVRKRLGPAPWDVMNDILARAGFRYGVNSPEGLSLLGTFELKAVDSDGIELGISDLSSGEQVLMSLMFWLYNSEQHQRLPKLLLLDEPDAHLHPAMTKQFVDVVHDILVKKHGVRVIMTTHSPSTVALSPDGTLFEMRRDAPRIVKAKSRARTVAELTAGVVTVGPGNRYVLVEDQHDAEFMAECYSQLALEGEVRAFPALVFIPASVGSGSGKVGGGRSVVEGWTEKLKAFPGVGDSFFGIADNDGKPATKPGVYLTGRHSLENYLLDPLNVFAALLDAGRAPVVPGVKVLAGAEYLMRRLSGAKLQSITDTILGPVEARLLAQGSVASTASTVKLVGRRRVKHPEWFTKTRGKDLLVVFQLEYDAKYVHPGSLLKAHRKVRAIPTELRDTLKQIQVA